MERDGDLLLNVSCSANQPQRGGRKLPLRMPDGSKIETNLKLTKKINKTHHPVASGKVFIPNHKLPVLDEFGLSKPSDHVGFERPARMLPSLRDRESGGDGGGGTKTPSTANPDQSNSRHNLNRSNVNAHQDNDRGRQQKSILKQTSETIIDTSSKKAKRRKRKKKDEEPKIIPKEVQAVAGGLPPSFPMHRIKKFTEEYQLKKRRREEEGDDDEDGAEKKKKRRSFVPGLNPRKREKASHLFNNVTLQDLHDLHPYLVSNLEQNFGINKLTNIQSVAMPELLQTRFKPDIRHELIINSGIGSGKILSYVVPIINNLALLEPRIDRTSGIQASFLWIVPGLLTGGERKKSEKARLRKGLNILISTPGRLIDHLEHSKSMEFSKMKYCVLADVHKLLDPERAEVAKQIFIVLRKRLPKNCVRCIVTATLTKKLEKLTEIIVSEPKIIDAFKQFD